MIFDLINSIVLLKDSIRSFEKYCVVGIKANRKQIEEHVQNSLMLVTALSPVLGYDKCAKIAHVAYEEHLSLRQATIKLGYLSGEEFDKVVVPEKMT